MVIEASNKKECHMDKNEKYKASDIARNLRIDLFTEHFLKGLDEKILIDDPTSDETFNFLAKRAEVKK